MKDTWDTRMAKLRLSADSFVRQQEAHAKVRWDGMQGCRQGCAGRSPAAVCGLLVDESCLWERWLGVLFQSRGQCGSGAEASCQNLS